MHESFGRYTLLERIAVGGMAEIFKAKAQGLGGFEKFYAIKRLHPRCSQDAEFIKMLQDEARITVALSHSNIGQVFDFDCVDDHYFIAMEYIDGRDLSKVFQKLQERRMQLSLDCAAFVAMEACAGLDYAHRKCDSNGTPLGIVHCDVSPQNLLVSFDGEVKVVDFGIAKATMCTASQHSDIKGKFYYMSPEQARGEPIDHRSDIFSLGIVLYEMLTGQPLYRDEDDRLLVERVRNAEIVPPSFLRSDIPDELERIVMQALAADREARYPSAQHMQQDLSIFLNDLGAVAPKTRLSDLMNELFEDERNAAPEMSGESWDSEDASASGEATRVVYNPMGETIDMGDEEDQTVSLGADDDSVETSVSLDDSELELLEEEPAQPAAAASPVYPTSRLVEPQPAKKEVTPQKIEKKSQPAAQPVSPFSLQPTPEPPLAIQPTPAPHRRAFTQPSRELSVPEEIDLRPQMPKEGPLELAPTFLTTPQPKVRSSWFSRERLLIVMLFVAVLVISAWVAVVFFRRSHSSNVPVAVLPAVLKLESTPSDAQIFINDVEIAGRTPYSREVEVGKSIHVKIVKQGYERFEQDVTLNSGETRIISAHLVNAWGSLSVLSEPLDARLWVNGQAVGQTPYIAQRLPLDQPVQLKLEKEGYETLAAEFSFGLETQLERKFTLKPLPAPPAPTPAVAQTNAAKPTPVAQKTQRSSTAARNTSSKTSASSAPSTPSAPEKTSPPATPPATPAPAPEAGGDGYLSVLSSQGWGAVYVNGKRVATETPLIKHKLPAGQYRVHLCIENDCLNRRTPVQTINLSSGQHAKLKF